MYNKWLSISTCSCLVEFWSDRLNYTMISMKVLQCTYIDLGNNKKFIRYLDIGKLFFTSHGYCSRVYWPRVLSRCRLFLDMYTLLRSFHSSFIYILFDYSNVMFWLCFIKLNVDFVCIYYLSTHVTLHNSERRQQLIEYSSHYLIKILFICYLPLCLVL